MYKRQRQSSSIRSFFERGHRGDIGHPHLRTFGAKGRGVESSLPWPKGQGLVEANVEKIDNNINHEKVYLLVLSLVSMIAWVSGWLWLVDWLINKWFTEWVTADWLTRLFTLSALVQSPETLHQRPSHARAFSSQCLLCWLRAYSMPFTAISFLSTDKGVN